jgi:hypothetical protein
MDAILSNRELGAVSRLIGICTIVSDPHEEIERRGQRSLIYTFIAIHNPHHTNGS